MVMFIKQNRNRGNANCAFSIIARYLSLVEDLTVYFALPSAKLNSSLEGLSYGAGILLFYVKSPCVAGVLPYSKFLQGDGYQFYSLKLNYSTVRGAAGIAPSACRCYSMLVRC